jgi:hypothetical protein
VVVGRGYTATATVLSEDFGEFESVFTAAFNSLSAELLTEARPT